MRALIKRLCSTWRHDSRSQDQYDFLPAYLELMERPPSPTARITAISISTLVMLALVWSCFGELDMHVQAAGELVLPSRSQEIQAYLTSEVVAIHVRNGQMVKAGDPLLVLNSVGTQQELRMFQEKDVSQKLEVMCYQALLSDNPQQYLAIPVNTEQSSAAKSQSYCLSMWQQYRADLAEFDAEMASNHANQVARQTDIKALEKIRDNVHQRLAAHRKLAAFQALSRENLLRQEHEALLADRDLSKQRAEMDILKSHLKALQEKRTHLIAKYRRDWHSKLNDATKLLPEIEQGLDKAREYGRLQTLRAPVDGVVQKLEVYTVGGIVQGAQKLMIITPQDAAQLAEVRIKNQDMGFIHPGETVTVKIDAFPYSRYGTIEGTVLSLSRDAVQERGAPENTPSVFPAQLELKQNYILLGDARVMLTPGMSILVNIKVGRRKVIDYIFSPIREYQAEAWREP